MVRALFVSVCLLAMVGCGGSSRPETVDCENFVEDHLCPNVVSCGAAYTSVGSCINYWEGHLGCSTVLETPGLAACEYDVDNLSCGYLVDGDYYATLPASCVGIFY